VTRRGRRQRHQLGIDAGGDNGDADAAFHFVQDCVAEDDIGVGIDLGGRRPVEEGLAWASAHGVRYLDVCLEAAGPAPNAPHLWSDERVAAVRDAVPSVWGVILQFPFYAGIAGGLAALAALVGMLALLTWTLQQRGQERWAREIALPRLQAGDAILLTRMEHHANIVPWQLVAQRTGAAIKVAEITPEGVLDLDALEAAMTPEVKILGVTHVSNVLGTINPVREVCRLARRRGITTVVDGSQALPHMAVDIPAIGCDFYALTGHKMCGPTGTGALWARREHLAAMPPFRGPTDPSLWIWSIWTRRR